MSPSKILPCRLRLAWALALVGCWSSAVGAGVSREAERRAARATIEARYQQAVQDCQGRFAVNACLQEARTVRQQALQPLQDEELAESLAQREQRASESRQRLGEKAQEQARLEARRRSEALLAAPPHERSEAAVPGAVAASRPARPVPDVEKLRREDEAVAAARARDRQGRVQKAEEHRREVLRRLEERAREKPPAAPLPPVSGSSASR
ncbi:MAG TPA: hypothetical protein VK195_10255 [Burkholderiaceae bacterium]|nr:hypothetical protein [Burkholderiaceae bacterium]